MTLKQQIKQLLEREPDARERKNRSRAVWYILSMRFSKIHDTDSISKHDFQDVFPEILSIVRTINQLQQFDVTLRGGDYEDGKILSQRKQIELGYEPGFHRNVKQLKIIANNHE